MQNLNDKVGNYMAQNKENNKQTNRNEYSIINESVVRKGGTKPQPLDEIKPDIKPEAQKKGTKKTS
ncbi:MAG: hypothetical protein IEMM0008_0629 [bacterium]|nr:MAG: hypothetical protein IEMM0008_0629 [bacterium]